MTPPAHILVVEDDPAIRNALSQGLREHGYSVEAAGTAEGARQVMAGGGPIDLITLDLNLAEADGLQLALEIRSRRNVPIIMISGRAGPEDRVIGFEHGADDYIVKPFHIKEVAHRIKNLLARYAPQASSASPLREIFNFELGRLDVSGHTLASSTGQQLALTDAEFDLLVVLARNAKRVLSREQLMQLLHRRSWEPHDRTLDVHVARLRRKIEPVGDAPRYIKSVRNVGYVFAADVTRI